MRSDELRIMDWSSDVCSSDLSRAFYATLDCRVASLLAMTTVKVRAAAFAAPGPYSVTMLAARRASHTANSGTATPSAMIHQLSARVRSEEHTSELQSLMRISYAVFCLKKKKNAKTQRQITTEYK